ncbi:glycosyltransferase family 4 protein [Cohnella lupini]|uniref:Glycosyltransferase involved in cell wall biosynthesis n=1 Tax=Cohnella lupini TaxID=1294267 RepID=A0A3D9I7X5_9BACL|nr:glycosyltransferase family 4 protein [Cohnella lupini]RED57639.1 glycosyltransferase involved in cell wall biosynthesis [Cohnella lupini]
MKKKIAICHAQVPFVKGGAELLVQSLLEELNKRNYHAELVALPFKWYPNQQLVQSMLNWRFTDLSESNGEVIDLVIATKFPSYGVKHKNKVTWLVHQFRQVYDLLGTPYSSYDFSPESLSIKELITRFDSNSLSESKKIFTIAQNTTDRLQRFNGISSEALYHPPKHVGSYYCDESDNFILSVGRLDKLKRIDILIKAMRHADKNVKCVIAGTGPERETLERLSVSLGLQDRVVFLGFVDDKQLLELYAKCMAVYFAPYDEDYGYVTLEAFLSKKPVITLSDSGGVLEFVKDGYSGLVLLSETEVAGAISRLYHNRQLAQELGRNGYEAVKDFSWDHVIDRLTDTIR